MRNSKNCNNAQSAKVAQEQLHKLISKSNLFIDSSKEIKEVIEDNPLQNVPLNSLQRNGKYDLAILSNEYDKINAMEDTEEKIDKLKALQKSILDFIQNEPSDNATKDIQKITLN